MPELPEVETVRRQLRSSIVGKKISSVFVRMDKMIKVGSAKISTIKSGSKEQSKIFEKTLLNKKIIDVERRAKFLIMRLSGGFSLIVHLRMSGQIIYRDKKLLDQPLKLSLAKNKKEEHLPNKHTHVEIGFSDGGKLFYNDYRQFGHMRLVDIEEEKVVMMDQNLGPEPLDISLLDFTNLVKAHPNKRAKDFLLNQQVIAGLGNIYVDESLFASGINPARKVSSLMTIEIEKLFIEIQRILRRAISLKGSSMKTFLSVNGASGAFGNEHLVYGRGGKECKKCGRTLEVAQIGGRTTVYCPHCQKLKT